MSIVELTREEALERFNADWIARDGFSNKYWYIYYGDKPRFINDCYWYNDNSMSYKIDTRTFIIIGYEGSVENSLLGRDQELVMADEGDVGKDVLVSNIHANKISDTFCNGHYAHLIGKLRGEDGKFIVSYGVPNRFNLHGFKYAYKINGEKIK